LYGYLGGGSYGAYGQYDANNYGYLGASSIGVFGQSNSSYGVYGLNTSSGNGVYGYSASGTAVRGYGSTYDFYAAGPGVDYGTSSSIRWKHDIKPIDNVLEKIDQLRGVYFTWDKEHGGSHGMGMIAEEVNKVVPEVVVMDKDAPGFAVGMDYGHLTPILIEGVKALHKLIRQHDAKIDTLQKQIADQQKQIDDQQKQIDELKAMIDGKSGQLQAGLVGNGNAKVMSAKSSGGNIFTYLVDFVGAKS